MSDDGTQTEFLRSDTSEVVAYAFEFTSDYSSDWTKRLQFEDPRENWPADKIRAVRPLVEK